ncbi:MAG: GntR family transcriptional regulator [Alphaproteobacteria bacterium]
MSDTVDLLASTLDAVRRDADTPLYRQVVDQLKRSIERGVVLPGAELPSERELSLLLSVSSITTKRALDELAQVGLITKARGRRPRVRGKRQRAVPGVALDGTMDALIESILVQSWNNEIDFVDFLYEVGPPDVLEILGEPGGATLQRATHIACRGGEAIGLVTMYVPEDIGRHFTLDQLKTTPRILLLTGPGQVVPDRAEQVLSAVGASPSVAAALGVEPGSPTLRVVRTIFDVSGRGVEHMIACFPENRFEFRSTLRRSVSVREDRRAGE